MRIRRMLVLLLTAALVFSGCGDDDDDTAGEGATATTEAESPDTTMDRATAEAEITATFEAFFDGKSAPESKVAYLEDGETFRESLIAGSSGETAELAKRTTTKVTKIELFDDDQCEFEGVTAPCAKVTHDLILDGTQVALAGQASYAVYVDDEWKLSKISYCGLLALGGSTPDVCK